jgi:hypothetical protein
MGTVGPFSGAKARPGLDADHSPPSSAEVKNKYKLYFLSPQAPPWRVTRQLFITYLFTAAILLIAISATGVMDRNKIRFYLSWKIAV